MSVTYAVHRHPTGYVVVRATPFWGSLWSMSVVAGPFGDEREAERVCAGLRGERNAGGGDGG